MGFCNVITQNCYFSAKQNANRLHGVSHGTDAGEVTRLTTGSLVVVLLIRSPFWTLLKARVSCCRMYSRRSAASLRVDWLLEKCGVSTCIPYKETIMPPKNGKKSWRAVARDYLANPMVERMAELEAEINRVKAETSRPARSQPALKAPKQKRGQEPRMQPGDQSVDVTGSAHVASITTGTTFVCTALSLTPDNRTLDPWMAELSHLFGMYRYGQLKFSFMKSCAFDQDGLVGLALVDDPELATPTSLNEFMAIKKSVTFSIQESSDVRKSLTEWLYLQRDGDSRPRLTTAGKLFYFCTANSASQKAGELILHYRVSLKNPTLVRVNSTFGYASIGSSTNLLDDPMGSHYGGVWVGFAPYTTYGGQINFYEDFEGLLSLTVGTTASSYNATMGISASSGSTSTTLINVYSSDRCTCLARVKMLAGGSLTITPSTAGAVTQTTYVALTKFPYDYTSYPAHDATP